MANFSTEVEQILKTVYAKEGITNIFLRNDPLLKEFEPIHVSGKEQRLALNYAQGGAVSANAQITKRLATSGIHAKEFVITPGRVYTGFTYSNEDALASRDNAGAYISSVKQALDNATEAYRKTMGALLYGSGYGELATVATEFSLANGANTIAMPNHAINAISEDEELEIKATKNATSVLATVKVTGVAEDDNQITVEFAGTSAVTIPANSVICIAGGTDSNGNPRFPVGLAGWIPTGTVASTDSFFGANRSSSRNRLAGNVVRAASGEAKYVTIQKLILKLRRVQGSTDDFVIVMNDEDRLALAAEIESKTYFQKVGGGKKDATVGYENFGFSVSTSWVDKIYDSPYCPKGVAYIVAKDNLKIYSYTDTPRLINDGVAVNEPGTANTFADVKVEDRPYQALVDDIFTIVPNEMTANGASTYIQINFLGQFVMEQPGKNGVAVFAD